MDNNVIFFKLPQHLDNTFSLVETHYFLMFNCYFFVRHSTQKHDFPDRDLHFILRCISDLCSGYSPNCLLYVLSFESANVTSDENTFDLEECSHLYDLVKSLCCPVWFNGCDLTACVYSPVCSVMGRRVSFPMGCTGDTYFLYIAARSPTDSPGSSEAGVHIGRVCDIVSGDNSCVGRSRDDPMSPTDPGRKPLDTGPAQTTGGMGFRCSIQTLATHNLRCSVFLVRFRM